MNAITSVKKVLHKFRIRRDALTRQAWESETDPYSREILRLAQTKLTMTADDTLSRVEVLADISHITYIGGAAAAKAAVTLLPVLFDIITDSGVDPEVRIQALRSLSEIGHRNRGAQEALIENDKAMDAFADFIMDVTRVRECRWTVYTLLIMSADNVCLMEKIKDHPGMLESLTSCSEFPIPWLAWGCNLADLLLKVLGVVHPMTPPSV